MRTRRKELKEDSFILPNWGWTGRHKMEKLRLLHLSSPRGSRLLPFAFLLTLLFRIRYAFPFSDRTRRRTFDYLASSSSYQLFDSADSDFVAKDFQDTMCMRKCRVVPGKRSACDSGTAKLTFLSKTGPLCKTFKQQVSVLSILI